MNFPSSSIYSVFIIIVPLEPTNIYVRLCNLGVCIWTSPITSIICASVNQDEVVARGLEEAEKRLEGENLEEALQTMLAVGEGVDDCSEVEVWEDFFVLKKRRNEPFLNFFF